MNEMHAGAVASLPALSRRPVFWAAFCVLAIAALTLAWKLFPTAIPLVNLDVKMSRADALSAAAALAERLKLAPADARRAIQFTSDGTMQNYVELEGGGKAAFAALVRGELYSPYAWDVRLFTAGSIPEVTLRFTPAGVPYGFSRTFAETYVRNEATKALDVTAARALAETRAKDEWQVDFTPWKLLEQSQKTQLSGRVDHAFVYQRAEKLGEARLRLRVAVAGDELEDLQRFVFVPQDFVVRYRAQRSANDTIANTATLVAGLLYGIGGCIVATLWLGRQGRLLPRPSFAAGGVVGALLGLMLLAATTGAWFTFDTAQTEASFWARQVGGAVAVALAGGLALGLVFMAAEGLVRAAFPRHPQLWKLWSREAGASVQVAGRTAGGYLFVPVELGLVAVFYYVTNHYLGWWQPSSEMTDPNVLSSAVPALGPIALSLQAGFMEECLFRAIPLALGALVGGHFGYRRLGIGVAFVLQALVFGAAHANYPGFPAYSRLVELIIPSLIWAAIFLRFGLLPTITLHALFDLSLFSIPVFLVEAPGTWLQRAIIIAAAAVPALIVLGRRARAGRWLELPVALTNGGWTRAVEQAGSEPPPVAPMQGPGRAATLLQRALPWLAVAGALLWCVTTPFKADVGALTLSRADAEAKADAALVARGVQPATWQRASNVLLASDIASLWTGHRYVWQEAGAAAYRALVGTTLTPPLWEVRYARFDGDVVDRTEEWRVTIDNAGKVRQMRHAQPEGRAGASLARADARALAEGELRARFGVDPAVLRFVEDNEIARPARRDWVFEWADPRVNVGSGGEARMQVSVTGDTIGSSGRTVFIPETWLTQERGKDSNWAAFKIAAGLVMALAGLAALVLGVRSFTRGQHDIRAGIFAGVLAAAAVALTFANNWPALRFGLSTTDPIVTQVGLRVGGAAIGMLLTGLIVGMLASVGSYAARRAPRATLAGGLPPWAAGVAAALSVAGVAAFAGSLALRVAPLWAPMGLENAGWPALAAALSGTSYVTAAALAVFLLAVLARLTLDWTRRTWFVVLILVMLYALPAVNATDIGPAIVGGVAAAALASIVVLWVFRFDPRTVPAYVATSTVLATVTAALQRGSVAGWTYAVLTATVVVILAWVVNRWLSRPPPSALMTPAVGVADALSPAAATLATSAI